MAEANHTSSDASEAPPPVLELRGVGKTFSGVHVLAGVDGLPCVGEMNFVSIEPDGSAGIGIVDAGDDSH